MQHPAALYLPTRRGGSCSKQAERQPLAPQPRPLRRGSAPPRRQPPAGSRPAARLRRSGTWRSPLPEGKPGSRTPQPCRCAGPPTGQAIPACRDAARRQAHGSPGGNRLPTRQLLLRLKFPALSAHSLCTAKIPARAKELYSPRGLNSPKPGEFDPKGSV